MALKLTPPVTGLIAIAALAVGWQAASLTQNPAPAQQARPAGGARALGTATVPKAEKLRERLSEPPLPSRGRNPFVYGSRAPVRTTSARDRESDRAADALPPMAAPQPVVPVFKLSGIASSVEGGATVLTAIVIDNGTMVFVKAGDKLSNGYSVVRVDELSLTLADADGVTQTIRLP
jgi:hypothetical protein